MALNSKILYRIYELPSTTPVFEKYKCIDKFWKSWTCLVKWLFIDGVMLLNYSFSDEFSFNYCKFRYHINKKTFFDKYNTRWHIT